MDIVSLEMLYRALSVVDQVVLDRIALCVSRDNDVVIVSSHLVPLVAALRSMPMSVRVCVGLEQETPFHDYLSTITCGWVSVIRSAVPAAAELNDNTVLIYESPQPHGLEFLITTPDSQSIRTEAVLS